jgi:hypothetical protein
MTPPKKPDWMEIADNDGGPINPSPVAKKSRPLLVAMAALTLTFGGALVAQTSQHKSGSTEQPLLVQASQSASVATPVSITTSARPATPSVKSGVVPAIAIPPSASGEDDDDYDDNDDDDNENDEDEDDEGDDH